MKDYGKAIECFRKAIELDPKFASTHFNLGNALRGQNKLDEAIAEYKEAIRLKADHAEAHCNLAEVLLTHPDPKRRDPRQALELARQGVEFARKARNPNEGNIWNTVGMAHYRTGDWKAAVKALEKSMELRKGGDSYDWFFLAMAHWQLGAKDKAREWYDRAVRWMDKNQPTDEELRRFRAEAAELLGLNGKK